MFNLIPSVVSAVLCAALLPAPASAGAQKQTGRVAHVADGASLDVLLDEKTRVHLRLAGIEIPAEGQAYNLRARQSLIAICGGEMATFEPAGKDKKGVMLARVSCNGRDANAEQVRLGLARAGAGAAPPVNAAQDEAKAARRGIWAPTTPSKP